MGREGGCDCVCGSYTMGAAALGGTGLTSEGGTISVGGAEMFAGSFWTTGGSGVLRSSSGRWCWSSNGTPPFNWEEGEMWGGMGDGVGGELFMTSTSSAIPRMNLFK